MTDIADTSQDDLIRLSAWQQAILDSSAYGIISTDTRGVIATFNRISEELLGYRADEVVGKRTPEIIHDPDEVVEYAAILSRELGRRIDPGFEVFVARARQGQIDNREWTYIRKDGSTFPVFLSVTAIRAVDGEIVGFLGTFLDLTERRAYQAHLRESESRYQALFDSASDGTFVVAQDGTIVDCNPAGARIFGSTQKNMVGRTIADVSPEFQADGSPSEDRARMMLSRILKGETRIFEFRHLKSDGTPFDIEVSASRVSIDNVPHVLGAFRDITERKTAEMERSRLISELEKSNAEMERFTHTISHELKTPLVSIGGFAGLLQSDAEAGRVELLESHVQRINGAIETMATLLDELLELSRIGSVAHQLEPVALGELAREVFDSLVPAMDAGRSIEFDVDDSMPEVVADRSRLRNVFKNLLENAIKFSAGQDVPRISVGWYANDGETIFFVEDNGAGIDIAYQERVFGLFERLDPQVSGNGVGLTLVQRIIEDHGGRVWVESGGLGHGSRFYFTLPQNPD